MAQACHGALEAGRKFPSGTEETNSIIVIGCKTKADLEKARTKVTAMGIRTEMFFEPDWEYGNASFGTEPIPESNRHIMKGFQLWKP
jgi:hypothetical protein